MAARRIRRVLAGLLLGVPLVVVGVVAGVRLLLDRTNGTLVVAGEERHFLLHVPERYDPDTATSLVLSFHGAALWPASQMRTTRWNDLADEHGFLVVYPAGRGVPRVWPGSAAGVAADVRFASELIDSLGRAYRIDPRRVYADGLSNGGRMAFVLSCRLADRIAAVGTVAAAQELDWSVCGPAPPVPVVSFHGTADPIVPYGGGDSWISPTPFPAVAAWTARWAKRNGCASAIVETRVAVDVRRVEYPDCRRNAAVVLYTIEDGGHTWPGARPLPEWLAGRTTGSIDATDLTWSFFEAHPGPRPGG